MESRYCPSCKKVTGFKRALGWGTFFGGVLTGGISLLAIPTYPLRCVVCGSKEGVGGSSVDHSTIFEYCSHCDAMIDEKWIHCQSCGGKLREDPSVSSRPGPTADTNQLKAETRLQELKNLFDKGLITVEEYEHKRAEILDEL